MKEPITRILATRNGITLQFGKGKRSRFRFFSKSALRALAERCEGLDTEADMGEYEVDSLGRIIGGTL